MSQLLTGIEYVKLTPETEVQVLEEPGFIDRYAGVIGMRGSVKTAWHMVGSDRSQVDILAVYPESWEERITKMAEAYARAGIENPEAQAREYYGPPPVPMSAEQVTETAARIKANREKREQYQELGVLQKVVQNVRYLMRKESLAISAQGSIQLGLPDIIAIEDDNGVLEEAIVLQEAEEQYRSLASKN